MVEEEEQIAFVLAESVPGTITEKVCIVFKNSMEQIHYVFVTRRRALSPVE